jgi:hypothetical protein
MRRSAGLEPNRQGGNEAQSSSSLLRRLCHAAVPRAQSVGADRTIAKNLHAT